MMSFGEWLANELDTGRDVMRIGDVFFDTEDIKECAKYMDTLYLKVSIGEEVSPLEKMAFRVLYKHLGHNNLGDIRIAYNEYLEECQ